MKTEIFEWVVLTSGEEIVLTEKQHKFLLDNQDKRFVAYSDFTINPAFVSLILKRPLQELKKKYPCNPCHTTGQINYEMCNDCTGSGVILP